MKIILFIVYCLYNQINGITRINRCFVFLQIYAAINSTIIVAKSCLCWKEEKRIGIKHSIVRFYFQFMTVYDN